MFLLIAVLVYGKKQRRKHSINRHFASDYIGLDSRPSLQNLIGRREKIIFAEVVKKYDRRFKVTTDYLGSRFSTLSK